MENSAIRTELPKNKAVIIGIIVCIIIAVLWFVYRALMFSWNDKKPHFSAYEASVTGVFTKGEQVPRFVSYDFNGNQVSMAEFIGKPVVLDFWAAWCVFCRDEMPELERIHRQMGEDVAIVGIHRSDTGETLDRASQFAHEQEVTYTLLQDPSGALYKAAGQGMTAMPVAVFIDADGIVRDIRFGPKTAEDIKEAIEDIRH